jgi:hypothetical protein
LRESRSGKEPEASQTKQCERRTPDNCRKRGTDSAVPAEILFHAIPHKKKKSIQELNL